MAYVVPIQWNHEGSVPAHQVQKYSDGLNALKTTMDAILGHPAAERADGETLYMLRKWRWLHYMSESGQTATLTDPAGTEDDVTLTASTAAMAVYDLDATWVTPGSLYQLTGVRYVVEDYSP